MKKYNKIIITLFILLLTQYSCKKDKSGLTEKVVYQTSFSSDDGNWAVGTTSIVDAHVVNGYYVSRTLTTGAWVTWIDSIFNKPTNEQYIEASIKVTNNGTNGGSGGLVWNLVEPVSGNNYIEYYFEISDNGYFTIYGYPNGVNLQLYKDWTSSTSINLYNFNTVKIKLTDGKLFFYVNGVEVYSMPAIKNTLDEVGMSTGGETTLEVDYFKAVSFE